MVTLATRPDSFVLFTKEPELTDAIFAAFNKHADALIKSLEKYQKMDEPFGDSVQMIKDRGGYSRSRKEQYMDPSNNVVNFMSFYKDAELTPADRLLLKPLVDDLRSAIAAEKERSPASWSLPPTIDNMISLLRSNPAVSELLNEPQIRR